MGSKPRTDVSLANRRSAARDSCLIRAVVEAEGEPAFDCTIWDMNQGGAKILVGNHEVPDAITVRVPMLNSVRRARVCWRGAGEIGIQFKDIEQRPGEGPGDQMSAIEQSLKLLVQAVGDLAQHVAKLRDRTP